MERFLSLKNSSSLSRRFTPWNAVICKQQTNLCCCHWRLVVIVWISNNKIWPQIRINFLRENFFPYKFFLYKFLTEIAFFFYKWVMIYTALVVVVLCCSKLTESTHLVQKNPADRLHMFTLAHNCDHRLWSHSEIIKSLMFVLLIEGVCKNCAHKSMELQLVTLCLCVTTDF